MSIDCLFLTNTILFDSAIPPVVAKLSRGTFYDGIEIWELKRPFVNIENMYNEPICNCMLVNDVNCAWKERMF